MTAAKTSSIGATVQSALEMSESQFGNQHLTTVTACTEGDEFEILVSVRMDFPLRNGEKHGDFIWDNNPSALVWTLDDQDNMQPSRSPSDVFGYSLDRAQQSYIHGAEVKLLNSAGTTEIASARTRPAFRGAKLKVPCAITDAKIKIVPRHCDTSSINGWPLYHGTEDKLFKEVEIEIEFEDKKISKVTDPYSPNTNVTLSNTHARIGNKDHENPTNNILPVSMKPTWWKDTNHNNSRSRRPSDEFIDMFVIHCTGGPTIGPALYQWAGTGTGAHFAMDLDGHIVKFLPDSHCHSHAGGSRGNGRWEIDKADRRTNERSIGIEILNVNSVALKANPTDEERANYASEVRKRERFGIGNERTPYSECQYSQLISLIKQYIGAHPRIQHRIVGHDEVGYRVRSGTTYRKTYDQRAFDPGPRFQWKKLWDAPHNLGMVPSGRAMEPTDYAGVFHNNPARTLDETDYEGSDAHVNALKDDLKKIGYNVDFETDNSKKGAFMKSVVAAFQRHFFSDPSTHPRNGVTDRETARMIADIADGIP